MSLTAGQIKRLRHQLEGEITDIRHRLDENDSYGLQQSLEESISELSHYDNHPADIGSEVFERSKDLSLRDADSLRLQEIDDALERMEDGEFGTCAQCGTGIPYLRLEANPAARHCIECQKELDEEDYIRDRPVEEEYLHPGFGRSFLDNEDDYNGFDGEDAWQAVARYGTAATNDENPQSAHPVDNYYEANERIGYVEDIEGFIITDIEGNPVDDPQFVRNDAYRRAWNEANETY